MDFGFLVVFWPLERKPPKRSFDLNVVLDSVHFLACWSDFGGFWSFLVDFCIFGGFVPFWWILDFLVDFVILVVFWPLERP